jgi:hypothetical protein
VSKLILVETMVYYFTSIIHRYIQSTRSQPVNRYQWGS